MADPTPTPPQPTKPKRHQSDLDQADLATLNNAEQIGFNAQKPAYAAAILAEDPDLTANWLTTFLQKIADTRSGQQTHKEGRAAVKTDLKAETKTMNDLNEVINEIRARAKTTYAAAPEKLVLYSVGVDIRTRKTLEAAADGIIAELAVDTVLKINPVKVTALTNLAAAALGK